jgi:hypothetical protein
VGIVIRTELCDDRKRTDDLEEHLTAKRELASIVADHGKDFQFEGESGMKFDSTPGAIYLDVIGYGLYH